MISLEPSNPTHHIGQLSEQNVMVLYGSVSSSRSAAAPMHLRTGRHAVPCPMIYVVWLLDSRSLRCAVSLSTLPAALVRHENAKHARRSTSSNIGMTLQQLAYRSRASSASRCPSPALPHANGYYLEILWGRGMRRFFPSTR